MWFEFDENSIIKGFCTACFVIMGIFLGFIIGALFSSVLILVKKKTMKDVIPFGPFLILGSVIAFVWGDFILNWYLGLT